MYGMALAHLAEINAGIMREIDDSSGTQFWIPVVFASSPHGTSRFR